jgi:diguanylate cyclase (GGDEF)-like protein
MFLDLDGFKNVNDTLGHSVGDELLRAFAHRIQQSLRKSDMLARWGGDEFVVLIPRIENIEEARILAQRMIDSLKQPFEICGYLLYVRSSIGIAIYPKDGADGETLVKNADGALYRSKSLGKNHYQFYTSTISSETSEKFKIENLLHQALEKEQFLLHYQPQINIKTGAICGMEALIRWNHPKLGLIFPGKFISVAEETGLIVPIGEWVLKTACQQNQLWQQAGLPPIRMAVNLSAQQFQQPSFIKVIKQILRDTKLDPQLLELEITETTIMQNLEFARQMIDHLRQMGIHISMDDFGTGYSSLGYLKQIPFHSIKIDQSFVRELKDDPEDLAIISAVLAIGKGFNLRVIAEGVETQQQVDLLIKLDCQEMQGYRFSRPLPVDEATKFLEIH